MQRCVFRAVGVLLGRKRYAVRTTQHALRNTPDLRASCFGQRTADIDLMARPGTTQSKTERAAGVPFWVVIPTMGTVPLALRLLLPNVATT
jgi:hypothetical protein